MLKFDLTTQTGCKQAANFFNLKGIAEFYLLSNPILFIGKMLVDKLFTSTQESGKVIEDIIRKGREEGVDVMEIIYHDKGGFDFNAPIDGVEIKAHAGKDNTIKMKVKYK